MTHETGTIAPVDRFVAVAIQATDGITSQPSPESGDNDVIIWYSDSYGGPAIDATLSQSATETSTAGTYQAFFAGSDLSNFLPDRVGSLIYRCVWLGNVLYKVTPLVVVRAE